MKLYYVYFLRYNDDSLYVGITNDVDRRLNEYNDGKLTNAYTYTRRPVKIEFF